MKTPAAMSMPMDADASSAVRHFGCGVLSFSSRVLIALVPATYARWTLLSR
jgi:hypothetical protein